MIAPLQTTPISVPKATSEDAIGETLAAALVAGGTGKVREILDSMDRANGILPPASASTGRRFYTVNELGDLPPQTWLVANEIPARGLTMLYGSSGSSKSFVTLDYGFRIAHEHERTVIYVAAEGASGYYDRATAWCKHHKRSGGRLLFDIKPLELRSPLAVQTFIEAIKPLQPALVIFDTLARCMLRLDENSARDMGIAVEACATIIRETGAAVMVVHHTGKNGMSERGSSALFAACDSVISITNDDGLIIVSQSKSKDGKLQPDWQMRLVEVEISAERSSCVVLPSNNVIMRGAPLTPTQKKILETLNLETFSDIGARAAVIQKATNIPDTSLFRALGSLMREGYITRAAKGDPYYIAEKGIQALQSSKELPPLPQHSHDSHGSDQNHYYHHSHS